MSSFTAKVSQQISEQADENKANLKVVNEQNDPSLKEVSDSLLDTTVNSLGDLEIPEINQWLQVPLKDILDKLGLADTVLSQINKAIDAISDAMAVIDVVVKVIETIMSVAIDFANAYIIALKIFLLKVKSFLKDLVNKFQTLDLLGNGAYMTTVCADGDRPSISDLNYLDNNRELFRDELTRAFSSYTNRPTYKDAASVMLFIPANLPRFADTLLTEVASVANFWGNRNKSIQRDLQSLQDSFYTVLNFGDIPIKHKQGDNRYKKEQVKKIIEDYIKKLTARAYTINQKIITALEKDFPKGLEKDLETVKEVLEETSEYITSNCRGNVAHSKEIASFTAKANTDSLRLNIITYNNIVLHRVFIQEVVDLGEEIPPVRTVFMNPQTELLLSSDYIAGFFQTLMDTVRDSDQAEVLLKENSLDDVLLQIEEDLDGFNYEDTLLTESEFRDIVAEVYREVTIVTSLPLVQDSSLEDPLENYPELKSQSFPSLTLGLFYIFRNKDLIKKYIDRLKVDNGLTWLRDNGKVWTYETTIGTSYKDLPNTLDISCKGLDPKKKYKVGILYAEDSTMAITKRVFDSIDKIDTDLNRYKDCSSFSQESWTIKDTVNTITLKSVSAITTTVLASNKSWLKTATGEATLEEILHNVLSADTYKAYKDVLGFLFKTIDSIDSVLDASLSTLGGLQTLTEDLLSYVTRVKSSLEALAKILQELFNIKLPRVLLSVWRGSAEEAVAKITGALADEGLDAITYGGLIALVDSATFSSVLELTKTTRNFIDETMSQDIFPDKNFKQELSSSLDRVLATASSIESKEDRATILANGNINPDNLIVKIVPPINFFPPVILTPEQKENFDKVYIQLGDTVGESTINDTIKVKIKKKNLALL